MFCYLRAVVVSDNDISSEIRRRIVRRILRTIFGKVFEYEVWSRRMNHKFAELYGAPSILTVAKTGTMTGACYEDAGLMPHQEGVRKRSSVRHEAQGSAASSIAGIGETCQGGQFEGGLRFHFKQQVQQSRFSCSKMSLGEMFMFRFGITLGAEGEYVFQLYLFFSCYKSRFEAFTIL